MTKVVFLLDSQQKLSFDDFKNLRKLYLPIIGAKSSILYEYFADLNDCETKKIFNLKDLLQHFQLNEEDYQKYLNKLEAVGLVNTFKKNDSNSFIYSLVKPNNIENLNKNPILKSHLMKIIGKKNYNKLYLEYKEKFVDKNNYQNVSKKYQEIFPNDFEDNIDCNDQYVTNELEINLFEDHFENIEKLPSSYFVKYITKRNPTYYDSQLINSLLKIGFLDNSINLLVDFSINVNNDIIHSYILKIAQDFYKRSIICFNDVKHELDIVKQYKNRKKHSTKQKSDFKNLNQQKNIDEESITLEDIFNDENIKEMF